MFFNPFFEAAELIHRFVVNASRLFASAGFMAMRFDYLGQGDSQGDFADCDIDIWIRNGLDAVAHLITKGADTVHLVGFDFGANVAAFVAGRIREIPCKLALCGSILDPEKNDAVSAVQSHNSNGQIRQSQIQSRPTHPADGPGGIRQCRRI